MTAISAWGVELEPPRGWDVEFSGEAAKTLSSRPGASPLVIHAGNFRLPANRGDFGSGAVEVMGNRGVLVALLEYDSASASTALFNRNRLPKAIAPDDVQTHTLQRGVAGQAGAQIFCVESGRAFCLYVVIGSFRLRHVLVPLANEVIATININE